MEDDSAFKYKQSKSFGSVFLSVLFSHVGLFLLVAAYAVAGAYLFISIERPDEEMRFLEKQRQALLVNETVKYMADLFWYYQPLVIQRNFTFKTYNETVHKNLKKLENYIIQAVNDFSYDGTLRGWEWDWTFSKSLLFTFTILTSIGYGHIYPVTFWGQIFCMIYAIIGVPILLIFLANLGDAMAKTFVYIYSRCFCRICRSRRYLSELPSNVSKRYRKLLIDDDVGFEEYMPTNEVMVPITLNLILLSSYIVLGGVLFSYWEKWDFPSSCYFTFITLSTIGYGDMVPGNAILDVNDDFGATLTMLIAVFYILLGMALLSMCINLMQEQLVEKVRWLGREIGFIKSDEVVPIGDPSSPKEHPEGGRNTPVSQRHPSGRTKAKDIESTGAGRSSAKDSLKDASGTPKDKLPSSQGQRSPVGQPNAVSDEDSVDLDLLDI